VEFIVSESPQRSQRSQRLLGGSEAIYGFRGSLGLVEDVTGKIIAAAIDVHRAIGPGLLESAYQGCMQHEFALRGIRFVRQLPLPVVYKGTKVDCAYRLDFLVEDVVLEIKSVAAIDQVHIAQVLTYMKLGGWHLGLLVNFNVTQLTRGIRRLIL
jgi:GxxExxY protein